MYIINMSIIDDLRNNRDEIDKQKRDDERRIADNKSAKEGYDAVKDVFLSNYRQWAKNNGRSKYEKTSDDVLLSRIDDLVKKSADKDGVKLDEKNSAKYYEYGIDFINNYGRDDEETRKKRATDNYFEKLDKDTLSDIEYAKNAMGNNAADFAKGGKRLSQSGYDVDKVKRGIAAAAAAKKAISKEVKEGGIDDFYDIYENYENYENVPSADGGDTSSNTTTTNSTNSTASTSSNNSGAGEPVEYTYKPGDSFGRTLMKMGLSDGSNLWGPDGDVAYYTKQLNDQGIYGNIPIGKTIKLRRRK